MPTKKKNLKVVDFFCGAGGMSYGLAKAGLNIIAGIDCDETCKQTYLMNIPGAKFLNEDITQLSPEILARKTKIKRNDDALIFAGCSPCQFYSKIRTDKDKSKKTAFLLRHFERFIKHYKPGYVVVENVPGLLTNKKSALPRFLNFLKTNAYHWDAGVVNTVHYGVPQHRKRYLLIATRLTNVVISLPPKTSDKGMVVRRFLGVAKKFPEIPAGHRDFNSRRQHTTAQLSKLNLRRIKKTRKNGGTRMDWREDPELQLNAYTGRDDVFRDVYGRMAWDKPAPTITTRFISLSNGRFGHPEEDRAISIREGATLQSFPRSFVFKGTNLNVLARQIGNAVPPELARRIGLHIMENTSHAKI